MFSVFRCCSCGKTITLLMSLLFVSNLPAADPDRQLQIVRAATRDRLTSFQSMHAEFTARFEPTKGEIRSGEAVWNWELDRESSREYRIEGDGPRLWRHWVWDGRKSTRIYYDLKQTGVVAQQAAIWPTSPGPTLLMTASMRKVLHMSIFWTERSLADILDSPSSHWVDSVKVNGKLLPTISSSVESVSGHQVQVICSCDPDLDWLPIKITVSIQPPAPDPEAFARWEALETAVAPIPGTGQSLHYAKRSSYRIDVAGQECDGVSYVDVTALDVNPIASDKLFTIDIPPGTRVFNYSKSSGKRAEESIAGGAPAEKKRNEKIVAAIETERQRVISQGTMVDASIPQGGLVSKWFLAISVLLAVFLIYRMFLGRA